VSNGTLYSSAKRAASSGVRRLPFPPTMIGGCGCCTGLGSAGLSTRAWWRPAKEYVEPGAVCHSPVSTSSCSVRTSKRSATGGNSMPNDRCSVSNQPLPSPTSTRPPLMASTVATVSASIPGWRKVADDTIVPSRIRDVSRASPASVTQASVEPGPGSPSAMRCRWSLRKRASKPRSSVALATRSRSS
jgi:hypothetical protein